MMSYRSLIDFQEGNRWYMTLADPLLWGPSFGALLRGPVRNVTTPALAAIARVYC